MNCIALLSSLPVLKREDAPFYTTEKFLFACSGNIPDQELEKLSSLHLTSDRKHSGYKKGSLVFRYLEWDNAFRNAIVRFRAKKYACDPEELFKKDLPFLPDAEKAAAEAFALHNPLEREKKLDDARWKKISELENGLLFSPDRLCAYKLKLELLEKWKKRTAEEAGIHFNAALQKIRRKADAK